jgi:hypothetical protein
MGPSIGHTIRHIRYEEFVALKSDGAGDFDGFLAAVGALVEQMGDVVAHHVLVDLRCATVPPLPEALLARALEHMRRLGLGVKNKVAVVTDRADVVRTDRADAAEAVAAFLLMQVRSFHDYGAALDWLSESERSQPGESVE